MADQHYRAYEFPTEENTKLFLASENVAELDKIVSADGLSCGIFEWPIGSWTAEDIEVLDGVAKILFGKVLENV